ncbi:efflux RND transporter periplasmic adaptor subunit [Stieleria sp. TO1_6]|uniref:efflux RND transporter periplasmic adaptor subunit n=1 Tax=Stieleria tagensis TaxID=2956795 RepID=UPI00209ADBE1|nr:efflux RND transporter periplasmic adaptor subunit [Stieleria tagensis]MCO8121086.1 efflux RND transporter periplasmic adaptor subunit [Stieleria tagensis]
MNQHWQTNCTRSFASLITMICLAGSSAQAQRPDSRIVAAPVIRCSITADQTFVASVRPTRIAVIGSAASGRVAECLYDEGQRVESMEPLVNLLTETIDSEIEAAAAELDLRMSELEELQNGTRVEELEQARVRMLAAEARHQFNAMRRARTDQLFRQGGSSINERDEAVTLDTETANEYLVAKAAYELAEHGPRPEKIAQAKAAADMQAAVLQKLKDQKRKHTIISRFAGYVVKEHTEVGAWVNTGDLVYEIAALDEVDVEAFVTERNVPHIRVGMTVNIEIPALDGRVFTGVVNQVVPQADLRTRTFPVRVRVKNEITDGQPLIKAGMLARVNLPIGSLQQANLVPKDAIVYAGPMASLIVIATDQADSKKGTVQKVPVQLGVERAGWTQVTGDIQPGQLVVAEGNERLRPGQAVVIAEFVSPPPALVDRSDAAAAATNDPKGLVQ